MRSKAIFVALLAFVFGAQAVPVSTEQAAKVARTWVRDGRAFGMNVNRIVDTTRIKGHRIANEIAFYEVPLLGGGRVFTAGDTEGEPVLAFTAGSESLSTNSPLYALLRSAVAIRQRKAAARAAALAGRPSPLGSAGLAALNREVEQAQAKWSRLTGGQSPATTAEPPISEKDAPKMVYDVRVPPMLTTRWSQTDVDGHPCYNYYVTNYWPCGCTATAASQIINYFRFPDEISSSLSFQCTLIKNSGKEEKVKLSPIGGPYLWDVMEDDPTARSPEEAFEAIGHLTYDVGIALNSEYSESGTSASPYDTAKMYVNTFGYKNAWVYWDGESYATGNGGLHMKALRERAILANLDAERPVQLGIYGWAKVGGQLVDIWGGHSVVADGYGFAKIGGEDVTYVHVNLGWGGTDDAWYNIPEIDTASAGALVGDDSGYDFLYLGSATFNLSTNDVEVGKEIVSGRVTDAQGRAYDDVDVWIFSDNGTSLHVTPNTNGIYYAHVDGGTNYDIRATSTDGKLIGWVENPIYVGVTTGDVDRVANTADKVGNYWGADLVMEEPSVRIGADVFPSLNRAIYAVERMTGDAKIEILRPTRLYRLQPESQYIALSLPGRTITVTATNENPKASEILRKDGAALWVKDGTVFFTNVAFRTESSTPVLVDLPGLVRAAGSLFFDDIISGTPGLNIADPRCFMLSGPLTSGLTLSCEGASSAGATFGYFDCDLAVAAESAARIVSTFGEDRAGMAVEADSSLRWSDGVSVDPAVAVGYVDGDTPFYSRSLDALFERLPAGADVVVLRSGARLSKPRSLVNATSTIRAGDDVEQAVILMDKSAGFTVGANGDLTVSGIAFSSYQGDAVLKVSGSGARLTLEDSAFNDITGTNSYSGALAVLAGHAEVRNTSFLNCRATGAFTYRATNGKILPGEVNAYGGAIYLRDANCSANLDGGSIRQCSARNLGGGIYVGSGAQLGVRGNLTIKGNVSPNGGSYDVADDIHLMPAESPALSVTGVLTGTDAIGVRAMDRQGVGSVFAAAATDPSVVAMSARAFFNDEDAEGIEAATVNGGQALAWAERTPGDNKLDPADPRVAVRVTKAGGATACFAKAEHAFDWIDCDATVEVLHNLSFEGDLNVAHAVTLRSAAPGRYTLTRQDAAIVYVVSSGSLTLADVVIKEASNSAGTAGFIYVAGGKLTLKSGAELADSSTSSFANLRAGGAVSVWNHATFTMESGAAIHRCRNLSVNSGSQSSYGGGLLADDYSTVYLKGGEISGCKANRGAGAFIGNNSTVYVSGDVSIVNNINLASPAENENLCVSDDSQLYLTGGELTGSIGYNEGVSADPNVFGKLADFTGSSADQQVSAHRFTHDKTGVKGVAVSNGSETLLVWASALAADGSYGDYQTVPGEAYRISVPQAVLGLVYDGTPKTGVPDGMGYALSGNVQTDAGDYTATVTLNTGFVWLDGSSDAKTIDWSIAPAAYTLSGVTFRDRSFPFTGNEYRLELEGELPGWLRVDYENNGRTRIGTNVVKAVITGLPGNYVLNPDPTVLEAKLIVVEGATEGREPVFPEEPQTEPAIAEPIAFKSIERVADNEWRLVITNRVPYCSYRLIYTDDLAKGFTTTGAWEQAAADATKEWTTNVIFSAGAAKLAYFWKAEGKDGEKPAQD